MTLELVPGEDDSTTEYEDLLRSDWWRDEVMPLVLDQDVDKRIFVIAPRPDRTDPAQFMINILAKNGFSPQLAVGAGHADDEVAQAMSFPGVLAFVSTVGTATETLMLLSEITYRMKSRRASAFLPQVRVLIPERYDDGQFANTLRQSFGLLDLTWSETVGSEEPTGGALVLRFAGEMLLAASDDARRHSSVAGPGLSEPERNLERSDGT